MTSSDFSVEGTASVKDEMGAAVDPRTPEQFEIDRLKSELDHFTKSGIIEIAVRNPSVSEYMEHWEGRALKAEALAAAPSRDQVTMGALPAGDDSLLGGWGPSQDYCERLANRVAATDAEAGDLLATIPYYRKQANIWRGIAAEMGYEPEAHKDVRPKEAWLLDRCRTFRAAASLVPTAEQGVVAQLGGAPDDLRNLIKVVFAGLSMEQMGKVCAEVLARRDPSLAAPPIAGAGEEPIAWRWKPKGAVLWIYNPDIEWLERQNDTEIDKEPLYSAASISQLYSRIGGLERERDEQCELKEHARKCCDAAGARLAEARELLEPVGAKYADLIPSGEELRHGAKHPDNMADDELALVTFPVGLFRRARSFHSPKEPEALEAKPS